MELKIGNKYIFDTSVFIDALRGDPKYKPHVRWLMFQARDKRISVGYSVITELELWVGIKGLWSVREHEILLRPFKRYNLLSQTARRAGNIRSLLDVGGKKGQGPGVLDCVIAATAEQNNLIIVTANVKDYQLIIDLSVANITIEEYRR